MRYLAQTTHVFKSLPILFMMALLGSSQGYSQTYPTFGSGTELSSEVVATWAPSMTVVDIDGTNTIYMAYADASTGDLYISTSTNGSTFSTPSSTGINIGTESTPSIAYYSGYLYVAYTSDSQVYVTSSSPGSTWSSPVEVTAQSGSYAVADVAGHPNTHAGTASLYSFGGDLYLAFDQTVSGETNVFYGTLDTTSFVVPLSTVTSDLTDYEAGCDPAMTSFNGNLVFAWCTKSYGMVVATVTNSGTTVSLAPMSLSNDPEIVSFNGDLYAFGESYYGDDGNLWGVASTNGSTWETEKEFSFDIGGGPAMTVLGSDLIEVARAKSNDYLWAYQGTI